jgi:hypothetical protein
MSNVAAAAAEAETFRELVIASRSDPSVRPEAEACIGRLNALYRVDPSVFTLEDRRWVNVLRGLLGVRLAHHSGGSLQFAQKAKRKGDKLNHCWRCETPVDERFVDICPTCDSKEYHWRTCPVCSACGCQRDGDTFV